VLMYKYTRDEYNFIKTNYKIDLDTVFLYYISEEGNLTKAVQGAGTRWNGNTYQITGEIQHFSVYAPIIEGSLPAQTKISPSNFTTHTNTITLRGYVQREYTDSNNQTNPLEMQFYVSKDTCSPQVPIMPSIVWENAGEYNFKVENFPLPYEGKNYIYLGYKKNDYIKFYPSTMTVIEKCQPVQPEIKNVMFSTTSITTPLLLSPYAYENNNVFSFSVTKPMTVYIRFINTKGTVVLELKKYVDKAGDSNVVWNGGLLQEFDATTMSEDQMLPVGNYRLIIYGMDDNRTVSNEVQGTLEVGFLDSIFIPKDTVINNKRHYRARFQISNEGALTIEKDADVIFEAGEHVHLNDGLKVKKGSEFKVRVRQP